MRPAAPGIALAAIAALSAPATADSLIATLGQPVTEVSHSVAVTIADGVATYKVQRVFANAGDRADEASLDIDLPPGAAATGLRIRARDRWYDGELLEREKAAAMYHEMTGMGAYEPKDPALLQWVWADKLHLQVFPVMPGSTSTVEYTLTVPTHYQGGQIFVSYPRLAAGSPLATPILTVHPAWADATTKIVVDGTRVVSDAPVALTAAVTPAWLDGRDVDPSASYAATAIDVPAVAATRGPFATATVTLDIDHTYKSDLRVVVVTPSGAELEVFGGAGGDANDVKGTFALELPAGTTGAGTWRLIASDHAARDAGTINQWSIAFGTGAGAHRTESLDTPVFVPDAPESASDAGLASIVVAPPAIDVAAVRLGKVVASTEHAFSRLEIDAAPELAPLPKRAQVVFVLDGSYSQQDDGIAAQLAIVKAYVAHVPDADVEIVVYRRTATRVFDRFVAGADLPARLTQAIAGGAFLGGNGSELVDGAELAVRALARRKGPRRIVLVTDELVRHTLTAADALAALEHAPAGTIVHVVVPSLDRTDEVKLVRDDGADFAALAAAHHGILARLTGLPAATDKPVTDAVLGLVRPIRIDDFAIAGLALDDADRTTLDEGDGVRAMIPLAKAKAADKVVLTGKIWGDGYRKVVAVDAAFSRATAAFVFSEDDHTELTPAEMMKVAIMGKAVSPVTSYLATEPGVRPSPIGLPEMGTIGGGAGFGLLGTGAGGGGAGSVTPDLMSLIAPAAKACIANHAPAGEWRLTIEVETTRDEIVGVRPTSITRGLGELPSCLSEAVWATRLTAAFTAWHDTIDLTFHHGAGL